MGWLRDVFLYLVGGVTFLPLCLLCLYIYDLPAEAPQEESHSSPLNEPALTDEERSDAKSLLLQHQAREAERKEPGASHGGQADLSTWLIVKNSWKTLPRKSDVCFAKDGTRLAPSRRNTTAVDQDDEEAPETEAPKAQRSYISYVYRGLRGAASSDSLTDAAEEPMPGGDAGRTDDEYGVYFAILRPPMLYLYNAEDVTRPGTECVAKVCLTNKRISIWDRDVGDVEGDARAASSKPVAPEGTLFTKRNALHISAPGARRGEHWYLMTPRASQLEDWYFALLNATHASGIKTSREAVGDLFSTPDMKTLINTLDDIPDQMALRWLNAMLGRVFLAVAHTRAAEAGVLARLNRRIERMRFPRLLSDVKITSVDLGTAAPTFGRPILKKLTPEGEASMEMAMHYTGNMRIICSATLTIPLGQRFKPYKVSVVLAVVLRSLEGNLLLQIKPPPSNRIWYGFTTMPKLDIAIEPVVSARKVRWSLITGMLESKVRDSVAENLVVPHMNSVPFFSTQNEARRGGIWQEAGAKHSAPPDAAPELKVDPVPMPISPASTFSTLSSLSGLEEESPVSTRSDPASTSAAKGLSTLLSNHSAASLASAAAQAQPGKKRSRYRAWLTGRSATLDTPPMVRSNSDTLPDEELERRLSVPDAAEPTSDAFAEAGPSSVPPSESSVSASNSIKSLASSDEVPEPPEIVPVVPIRPDVRVPPEVPEHQETPPPPPPPPRQDTIVPRQETIAPPPRRFATSDEFGDIPTAPQRRSRITTLARTLQDSMDRDGRQVIARDAKDALKRGWSNWSSKRVDGRTMRSEFGSPTSMLAEGEARPERPVPQPPMDLPASPSPAHKEAGATPVLDNPALQDAVLEAPAPSPSSTLPLDGEPVHSAEREEPPASDALGIVHQDKLPSLPATPVIPTE